MKPLLRKDTARSDDCWDCGHPVSEHSGEYPNWDQRGVPKDQRPPKKPGEGCRHAGCPCQRWFEVVKS